LGQLTHQKRDASPLGLTVTEDRNLLPLRGVHCLGEESVFRVQEWRCTSGAGA